jgi:PST family polysaccharide transporter
MLRWQLLGDLLKIPGWAFGFVLLARGDRGVYVLVELLFALVYGGATFLLVPRLGLDGAGIAYLAAYLVYGIVIALVCNRRFAIAMSRENVVLLSAAILATGGIKLLSDRSETGALIVGGVMAAGFAVFALRELKGRAGLSARAA